MRIIMAKEQVQKLIEKNYVSKLNFEGTAAIYYDELLKLVKVSIHMNIENKNKLERRRKI